MADEGRGRGLFLTQDVAAGTLLLAEKALVAEAADASQAHFAIDLKKKTSDSRSQDAVLQQALQQALTTPLTNARLHSLYDGSPASASRIPSMKLFRTDDPEDFNADDHVLDQPPVAVDQVRGIVKYNTFGYWGGGFKQTREGDRAVGPGVVHESRAPPQHCSGSFWGCVAREDD